MRNEEIIARQREEEDYYTKEEKSLSKSLEEAQKRYEKYYSKDPYPDIEAALLNSADVFRYVAKTGMIYPFYHQKLQGASYEVAIKGTVIWWDEEKKIEHQEKLEDPGDSFKLEPNSIAFITLEPMFRIPDYMALRFNLKIVHVYKGLLLGTGPIVDPGFVGKLSIPLHNLTSNTYTFHAGDGIIQMEFTKLSRNDAWLNKPKGNTGLYKRKWIKPERVLKEYITRALNGSSDTVVKSSIPNELSKLKEQSKDIRKEMDNFKDEEIRQFKENKEEIEKTLKNSQIINVATIISIAVLVVSIMSYACSTISQLGSANSVKQERIYKLETEYDRLVKDYESTQLELNEKIEELSKKLEEFEAGEEIKGKVLKDEQSSIK